MTNLIQKFKLLKKEQASFEKDKENLIYNIFEALNVNYQKKNDSIEIKSTILFNDKEKDIKRISIYFVDNENKHVFPGFQARAILE